MILPFSRRYTSQKNTSIFTPLGGSSPAGELKTPWCVPRPIPWATTQSPILTRLRTSQVASGKISNQLFQGSIMAFSPLEVKLNGTSSHSLVGAPKFWMYSRFF